MQRFRPYVLPVAIVLGLLLHRWCAMFSFLVPFIIFSILLLTFTAVDLRRLRMTMIDLWLILFQVLVSISCFLFIKLFGGSHIVAEGVLIGVLCPVASSVAVVAGLLDGFLLMFSKIGSTLALPFFLAVLMQFMLPRVNNFIAQYKGLGFYLWSVALLFTLGQTIDYIFLNGEGNWSSIVWLGILSLSFCVLQFAFGRWLGKKYGDVVGGGQLLGQKNSAMGIWMANTFLTPLSSVFLAFYSVFQNVFNAWQLAHIKKK